MCKEIELCPIIIIIITVGPDARLTNHGSLAPPGPRNSIKLKTTVFTLVCAMYSLFETRLIDVFYVAEESAGQSQSETLKNVHPSEV